MHAGGSPTEASSCCSCSAPASACCTFAPARCCRASGCTRSTTRSRSRSTKDMAWPVAVLTVVGSVRRAVSIGAARSRAARRSRPPCMRRGAPLVGAGGAAAPRPPPPRRTPPPAPAPAARRRRARDRAARPRRLHVAGNDHVVLRKRAYRRARRDDARRRRASRSQLRDPPQRQAASAPCASRCGRRRHVHAPHADPRARAASACARAHVATPELGAARGPKVERPRRRAARRAGRERAARAAAPARPRPAALRRPAQRQLRRRDRPRGDGVPQGQRHGAPLRRRPRA